MDPHDLFRQLTRGARFSRKKPSAEKKVVKEKQNSEELNNLPDEDGLETDITPKKQAKQLPPGEKLAKLRKEHHITVLGKSIPPPITSFEELQTSYGVSEHLVKNLTANYTQPTPIQMQTMPLMLLGRPLMACAPTGSGKTIAFLAPIISALGAPKKVGFRAIILAPTRELSHQIYRECARLAEKSALKIHFISKANHAERDFGPQSSRKFDILVSTPNRIRYLLQQEPPLLNLGNVEWFVLDEADRLMEEGINNFKDQLDDILAACTNTAKKISLFSATYTIPVAKWALKNLKNLARVNVGQQNAATDTVEQELLFVGSESGKLLAMRNLVRGGVKPPVLVFVQSKERAKELFQELLYDGINVDVIHADRTQQQRGNCVRAFREGNIWVLICTELMGRGIDFKGVNLVINYDFPPSTISYIHRIGRAGRAGRRGKAITFFTESDTSTLRSIAQIIKNSGGKVPDFMLQIKKPRKSLIKKLANAAPKRDHISTSLKTEAERQMQLEALQKDIKKQRKNDKHNEKSERNAKGNVKKVKEYVKLKKENATKNKLKK